MTTDMRHYVVGGCRLLIPDGWQALRLEDKSVVVVLEPESSDLVFRGNIVLAATAPGDLDLSESEEIMLVRFPMYQLIDLGSCRLSGFAGVYRLAEYMVEGAVPVTMEQWMANGYSLTATVDTWRYSSHADLFGQIADDLSLPGPVGSPGR